MTLFLSQIILDKITAARYRLSDAYAWHSAIWKCFPDRPDKNRDFLFRCDEQPTGFCVLILSPSRPISPDWGRIKTREVNQKFLEHPVYHFQIKANPTMRRQSDGRRLGIYQVDKLKAWLDKKARDSGFEVISSIDIVGPIDAVFFRNGKIGKHTWADFKGVLEVRDVNRFKTTFATGIGSAKSFGYGMLMLKAISNNHLCNPTSPI